MAQKAEKLSAALSQEREAMEAVGKEALELNRNGADE